MLTLVLGLVYRNVVLVLPAAAVILLTPAIYPHWTRWTRRARWMDGEHGEHRTGLSGLNHRRGTRVRTPRLRGVLALVEFKMLRSHALRRALPFGVTFMCLGQLMTWWSSLSYPLAAWGFAGISFGLATLIIYRESDDAPTAFIRTQVGFPAAASYLHLLILLVITALLAAGIAQQPAFGAATLVTAAVAYCLGGRVQIVPTSARALRYRNQTLKPTLLLEMLVLLVLLGVWWLIFVI